MQRQAFRNRSCTAGWTCAGEAVFTIDSADTKDIDDAVSIARRPGGFSLGVHIADVSHYVKPGTALEEAAFRAAPRCITQTK